MNTSKSFNMSLEIALARIKEAKEYNSRVLDLSELDLEEIPREIGELQELTHLFLQKNRIEDLEPLAPLKKLQVLAFYNNQVQEIPSFLLDLQLPFLWDEIEESDLLKVINDLNFSMDFYLDNLLSKALALTLDLARAPDLVIYLAIFTDIDLALDLAVALDRAMSKATARSKTLARSLTLALAQIRDLDRDGALERDRALERDQHLFLDRPRDKARALAQSLEKVLDLGISRAQALSLCRALDKGQVSSISFMICLAIALLMVELQLFSPNLTLHLLIILEKCPSAGILLKDNPLMVPPPEIVQKGDDGIKIFLTDFIKKQYLNEVKVILVGEGASGKTSLVKQLLQQNFDQKEAQTDGIKITKQRFKHQGNDLLIHFWDFGGQEIMHATHQFFLTKRCLYLLVLDSRKDEKAEYWLNYIKSFGGDAPVLIVLNKIDQNSAFEVNRKFLNKKHPNILNYYRISCAENIGINALKKDMLDYLWNLELRSTAFPKGWLKVKTYMEKMTKDYISYTQYQTICEENYVPNKQSQKVLLELLNDLGVVMNYENLRLFDTHVLNPLWLTNAVYRIINSPILAEYKGRFHINDLDGIINDPRYQKENPEHWHNIFKFWKPEQKLQRFPEEKFLFIVAMMKQFELLFQLDDYHYLIPGLLPDEENTVPFSPSDPVLNFVIEYQDFLPTAIIPRLMVKLHKYIYQEQRWKTGMVLEEKLLFHSLANIVLDKENKTINIEIKGQRNRDFLSVIRETIREINETYQDIEVTEWVPLPDLYKGEQLLVDYQELLGYEEGGQKQYYSGKLKRTYAVADLLNGIEKPEMRQDLPQVNIFISYALQDFDHKEKLVEHLMPLKRLNKAKLWDNSCINPGDEIDTEIIEQLAKADIVLCLISSSYVASDFCDSKEMGQALKAHDLGKKTVIPIKIKQVNWDSMPIAQIQGLPRNTWMNDLGDSASWTEISKGVEVAIEALKEKYRGIG